MSRCRKRLEGGSRCRRKQSGGCGLCWQHGGADNITESPLY